MNEQQDFRSKTTENSQKESFSNKCDRNSLRDKYRLIELPKIVDPRGNLTVVEQKKEIPFEIRRAYWTYDVPEGESRGGHAHKQLTQLLIATSGSFNVTLDNGKEKKTILLNHPWQGLLINSGIWQTIDDFSSGAVCLVLASDVFDEEDYISDYDEFINYVECSR